MVALRASWGKRLWPFLVALLILTFGCAAQGSSAMRLVLKENGKERTIGTAVLVRHEEKHWILTAYHVIRGRICSDGAPCIFLAVQNLSQTPLTKTTLPRVSIFPELGLAAFEVTPTGLAELHAQLKVIPAQLTTQVFGEGTPVVAVGNPEIQILNVKAAPVNYVGAGTVGLRRSAGSLLPPSAVRPVTAEIDLLFVDGFTITYGFSGGPMFRQDEMDGRLVGIVEGGDAQRKNRSWAVPADVIYDRLATGAGVIVRENPFGNAETWPADGFKDNNVYGSLLGFPSADQRRVDIRSITPTPLPPLPLGGTITVGVVARFPDKTAFDETFVLPLPPRGIRVTTRYRRFDHDSSDSPGQFEWSIEATSDAPLGLVSIPFEVYAGNNRELLGRFEIEVDVVNPKTIALAFSGGYDYENVDGNPLSALHALVELQIGALAWPARRVVFVAKAGLGFASLRASQKTFAPLKPEVLWTEPSWNPGVRLQGLVELRWLGPKAISLGLASGFVFESFVDRTRNLSVSNPELTRKSVPLEFSVAYRSLVVRPRVSYYFSNPKVNNRSTGVSAPSNVVAMDLASGLGFGVDLGTELWF